MLATSNAPRGIESFSIQRFSLIQLVLMLQGDTEIIHRNDGVQMVRSKNSALDRQRPAQHFFRFRWTSLDTREDRSDTINPVFHRPRNMP